MSDARAPRDLRRLAHACGVATSYVDVHDRVRQTSTEALLGVLRALGVRVQVPEDAAAALDHHRRRQTDRMLPPVCATFGSRATVELTTPAPRNSPTVACRVEIEYESGRLHRWVEDLTAHQPTDVGQVDGRQLVTWPLRLSGLPPGYHRLTVELAGTPEHGVADGPAETLLIAAPRRAWRPAEARPGWGGFLPLYAVRTDRDWGAGDLTDLEELAGWLGERGADVVATLPLLPTYLGGGSSGGAGESAEPFDPSPYSPVSRLFWNELVLDLARAPEWERCPRDRQLFDGQLTQHVAELRSRPLVDYHELAAVKGRVLATLSQVFFDGPGRRRADLDQLVADRPEIRDYAWFRAAVTRHGPAWWRWPATARDRRLNEDSVNTEVAHQHLYAQLLAHQQTGELSGRLAGRRLYLDLPVGARADGYDVWQHRELFALDTATGAPPDDLFAGGQNWSFPPLHPWRLRAEGYGYWSAVLRHHMSLADLLRLDHVMALHRLWWIPDGHDADDGAYVAYPADELYAVVLLESHRQRCQPVGENLGTVPDEVEAALGKRGVGRLYVVEHEAAADADPVLPPVPGDAVASINTHDMPPLAGWLEGKDIDEHHAAGIFDDAQAAEARAARRVTRRRLAAWLDTDPAGPLDDRPTGGRPGWRRLVVGLLAWLGASAADVVLVNLEDLWGESEPQNVPGTGSTRPNWRRRATRSLDEMGADADLAGVLDHLNAARTRTEKGCHG